MTPRILFVSLSNDIGLERLAGALTEHGASCAVLSPPGFYCTKTRHITRHFILPRHRGMWLGMLRVRARLERAVCDWSPDLVVPLDDVAAWLLRRLAVNGRVTAGLRTLLTMSFGSPAGYPAACTRIELMRMASRIGVRVPDYCGADTPSAALKAAEDWGYPVVLKTEYSCGGHGVVIAAGPEPLERGIDSVATYSIRPRVAAKHVIWRAAGLRGATNLPPILQAFVPGTPAMYTVSAWEGRVLDGVGFVAERTHPKPTGTSSVVRCVANEEMKTAARLLVKELGCSGFVSFDFILSADGDRATLIEMNPRPIPTSHLGATFGHDLCRALVARLGGKPALSVQAVLGLNHTVALFPKELARNPHDLRWLHANDVVHDMPRDDPSVVAAYLEWLGKKHPGQIEMIKSALGQAPVAGHPVDLGVLADETVKRAWTAAAAPPGMLEKA